MVLFWSMYCFLSIKNIYIHILYLFNVIFWSFDLGWGIENDFIGHCGDMSSDLHSFNTLLSCLYIYLMLGLCAFL